MIEWDKIKQEYISSEISYRELAKKSGVTFQVLSKRAMKEHWTDLRRQTKKEVDTNLVKKVAKANTNSDALYFSILEKLLKKVEECIMQTDCKSPNAIKTLTSAMRDLQACKGVKSEADAREQEARILKLRKEAQEEDNTSKVIKIEIAGEAGEYCE